MVIIGESILIAWIGKDWPFASSTKFKMSSSSQLWCQQQISVTVEGPTGRISRIIKKPFARIGSHEHSEIVLPDVNEIPRRCFYLHATDSGVYSACLMPSGTPGFGRLTGSDSLSIGPYRICAQVASVAAAVRDHMSVVEHSSRSDEYPMLSVVVRDRKVANVCLRRRLTIVGNTRPSTLRLKDDVISGCHCVLYREGDEIWVIDLLSTSGSKIGQLTVDAARLEFGECVQLHNFSLKYEAMAAGSSSAVEERTGNDGTMNEIIIPNHHQRHDADRKQKDELKIRVTRSDRQTSTPSDELDTSRRSEIEFGTMLAEGGIEPCATVQHGICPSDIVTQEGTCSPLKLESIASSVSGTMQTAANTPTSRAQHLELRSVLDQERQKWEDIMDRRSRALNDAVREAVDTLDSRSRKLEDERRQYNETLEHKQCQLEESIAMVTSQLERQSKLLAQNESDVVICLKQLEQSQHAFHQQQIDWRNEFEATIAKLMRLSNDLQSAGSAVPRIRVLDSSRPVNSTLDVEAVAGTVTGFAMPDVANSLTPEEPPNPRAFSARDDTRRGSVGQPLVFDQSSAKAVGDEARTRADVLSYEVCDRLVLRDWPFVRRLKHYVVKSCAMTAMVSGVMYVAWRCWTEFR